MKPAPRLTKLRFYRYGGAYETTTLNRPNGKRMEIIRRSGQLETVRVFTPDASGYGAWDTYPVNGCPLATQALICAFHKDEL